MATCSMLAACPARKRPPPIPTPKLRCTTVSLASQNRLWCKQVVRGIAFLTIKDYNDYKNDQIKKAKKRNPQSYYTLIHHRIIYIHTLGLMQQKALNFHAPKHSQAGRQWEAERLPRGWALRPKGWTPWATQRLYHTTVEATPSVACGIHIFIYIPISYTIDTWYNLIGAYSVLWSQWLIIESSFWICLFNYNSCLSRYQSHPHPLTVQLASAQWRQRHHDVTCDELSAWKQKLSAEARWVSKK